MLFVESAFVAAVAKSRAPFGVTHILVVFDRWRFDNFNNFWLYILDLLAYIIRCLLDELIVNLSIIVSRKLEHEAMEVIGIINLLGVRNLILSSFLVFLDVHSDTTIDRLKVGDLLLQMILLFHRGLFPFLCQFGGEVLC